MNVVRAQKQRAQGRHGGVLAVLAHPDDEPSRSAARSLRRRGLPLL
ncbi:MAG TPA: hypothetical protein VMT16_04845 [Thermoanaerobaculia bacterium]|nr:hypothetical protein [Thermoanaerobaculia bacterium]